MPHRTIAIGDIHGHLDALKAVLQAAAPEQDDTILTLGDYVDRGPASRGVIDFLLGLRQTTNLIPLLGNHDRMFLDACDGDWAAREDWLQFGGRDTVDSYGGAVPDNVPEQHLEFLRTCRLYYETPTHIFLHASYIPQRPMDEQPEETLLWDKLRDREPGPHCSGKQVIVGHTAQKDGRILDLGHLICIDTCCYCDDGWLTALDTETGQIWQADKHGQPRS